MKFSYQYLMEQANNEKHGTLTFGRMNPPHRGHAKLIQKVDQVKAQYGGESHIVLSSSWDKNNNPLTPEQKMKYVQLFFPDHNIELASKDAPGIIQQVAKLNGQFDHLHIVCGQDRIPEFRKLLHKYNNKNYKFKTISFHSSGKRDATKSDTTGVSSTKMRTYAKEGNWVAFIKSLPNYIENKYKEDLYNDVRKGMGINEDIDVLFEQFSQGYPITPDGGPGDNPDPVKEKDVDFGKVKLLSVKKQRKWSSFKTKLKGNDVVGSKLGGNQGTGIGDTFDTRYGQDANAANGIGDPSFRESVDSPSETAFMPAFGITGSSNKDPLMTPKEKELQNNQPSKNKNSQKWRDFRKSLGVPIG